MREKFYLSWILMFTPDPTFFDYRIRNHGFSVSSSSLEEKDTISAIWFNKSHQSFCNNDWVRKSAKSRARNPRNPVGLTYKIFPRTISYVGTYSSIQEDVHISDRLYIQLISILFKWIETGFTNTIWYVFFKIIIANMHDISETYVLIDSQGTCVLANEFKMLFFMCH